MTQAEIRAATRDGLLDAVDALLVALAKSVRAETAEGESNSRITEDQEIERSREFLREERAIRAKERRW